MFMNDDANTTDAGAPMGDDTAMPKDDGMTEGGEEKTTEEAAA